MTMELITRGETLAATLERENAALAALDLPRAVAVLADKQQAVAALADIQAVPMPHPAAERMARRLQALAAENKRLLERAIAAQGRVIGVIARAAAPSTAPAGYGIARGHRPAAVALSAKA